MFRRFVLLIAATLPIAGAADIHVVEEIAAKVNGDIITRSELEQQRRELEQQLRSEGLAGAKLTDAVKQNAANALRDEIDQLLLVQRAKDLSINVDPDVTRELADMQVRTKITDPDKFQQLIQQQYGMSYEDFRDRMKRQYLAQRVIGQEVGSRVNIPETDLHKYYDEHKSEFVRKEQVFLSQILISTEGKTPEQAAAAEKKAKDLVVRARKGLEKFTDLVRDNSDDPETARNGGSLPPMQPDQLQPQISAIVFKEPKGYVTDPIKVPQGYVILRIDERYAAGQATFEEVKGDIQDRLARPLMEPKIREYLTRLRQQAFLEIKEGYVDSGAAPGKDTRWEDVAQLKPQTTTKEEVASRGGRHKRLFFIPLPFTSSQLPPAHADSPAAAPAKPEAPVKQ
jgi:peptidyl-prolyl cis-trans isomerase SurA